MKARETEEGKTAQDNFTRAMKTLFRTPKSAVMQQSSQKPPRRKRKAR